MACGQKSKDYLIAYVDATTGEELTGYKNTDGEIIIKSKYTNAPDTLFKMAIVLNSNSEFVCIDRSDKIILKPFIYDNGPDYLEEGLFRFIENDKIGFANSDGQKIVKANYDFATPFKDGLSEYTLGGHREYEKDGEHWSWTGSYETGFINKNGQEFVKVSELNDAGREGWTKDKKHFLLNKNGEVVKTLN
jgi:hypothetical protein